MTLVGAKCDKTALLARDKLCEAGLLVYEKGKKGQPSRYRMVWFPRNDSVESSGESSVESFPNAPENPSETHTSDTRKEKAKQKQNMKEITTKKLLDTIIEGVRNRKGQRIVNIDLRKIKEAPVEMMLICEGQSNTQVSAIADEIDDFVRTKTHVHPLSVAGQENAEWIAMDYGTIFVHVMQREPRAFYDIEHLWADGKITELPEML